MRTASFLPTLAAALIALIAHTLPGQASPLEGLATRAPKARVHHTCSARGTVALTFDDGPFKYHESLVNELNRSGAKGTFFVNGNNYGCIYDYAEQLKATFDAGHMIGSHTWTHVDITKISRRELNSELHKVEIALRKILGIKPKFFRPPYGNINTEAREVLAQRGYEVILWDKDSGDSVGKSTSYSGNVYSKIANSYPKPHLVLNHETYKGTVHTVVPNAMPELMDRGYSLVTAAECLDMGSNPSGWYEYVADPESRNDSWQC